MAVNDKPAAPEKALRPLDVVYERDRTKVCWPKGYVFQVPQEDGTCKIYVGNGQEGGEPLPTGFCPPRLSEDATLWPYDCDPTIQAARAFIAGGQLYVDRPKPYAVAEDAEQKSVLAFDLSTASEGDVIVSDPVDLTITNPSPCLCMVGQLTIWTDVIWNVFGDGAMRILIERSINGGPFNPFDGIKRVVSGGEVVDQDCDNPTSNKPTSHKIDPGGSFNVKVRATLLAPSDTTAFANYATNSTIDIVMGASGMFVTTEA